MAVKGDPSVAATGAEGEQHYRPPTTEAAVVKVASEMLTDGEILKWVYVVDSALAEIRSAYE